jgi:hypothetical protein
MREMEDCWPSGVGPAGVGAKPPCAALAEDRRGERSGRRRGLISSGGDQEDVPESSGPGLCPGRALSFEASKPVETTSKPRSGSVLGMSLAAARVAGQVVSGVEAASSWSAALAWNVRKRASKQSSGVAGPKGRERERAEAEHRRH